MVFFCAKSLKKNNYSINNLFQFFLGEMVSISVFPCFYPPVCKLLVFQI